MRPLEHVTCNWCGADDTRLVTNIRADFEQVGVIPDEYAYRSFQIVQCSRCNLIYLNPRPDAQEIGVYYPKAYCCFAEMPPKGMLMGLLYRVMVALKRREILPRLASDATVLDYGCGNGHWLVALKAKALPTQRFVGVDFSESAISSLRAKGVEAYVGDERALERVVAPGSVDLILMNHIIEHIPDVKGTMRVLSQLLKPGGEIHGVTPNIDAWDRNIFGEYWSGWHCPRHFVLFTREVLARYAKDAGLTLTSCKYDLEGANHWSTSLHTVLAGKLGWRRTTEQYRMKIYPLFLFGALLLTVPQMLFSKASVMTFTLRKPS